MGFPVWVDTRVWMAMDESVDETGFHLGKVGKTEDKPGGGRDGDGRFRGQGFERRQSIGLGEAKMELECVIAFGKHEVGDEEWVSGLAFLFVEREGSGNLQGGFHGNTGSCIPVPCH